ncbi:glutathione S-transferase, partial [Acinetobacter baumannii]|nr:glutathione S-transferase [Klebsiella pneumoniae]MDT1909019.1 glutathione S-transferase [Acinetobacter baumannii]
VHIEAWRQRVEQRPAWQRAIERGGPFTLPGA